jgi:carboxylesterase
MKYLLLLSTILLATFLASAFYNRYARKTMHQQMQSAEREPNTNFLKGASPVRIDRDRNRACLLLHGYMSAPPDYGQLPEALDNAGWDVYVPLLPQHGTNPKHLKQFTEEHVMEFCRTELKNMQKTYKEIVLIGFSMGGAIATILCSENDLAGLVLINPYFASPYYPKYVLPVRWWHRLLSPLLPYVVNSKKVFAGMPGAGSEIVAYSVLPTKTFGEVFKLGDKAAKIHLDATPLLVLLSQKDRTASVKKTTEWYKRQPAGDKRLYLFEESGHILLQDYDREEASQTVLRFLGKL